MPICKIGPAIRPHCNWPEVYLDLLLAWSKTQGSFMARELNVNNWDDIYLCCKVPPVCLTYLYEDTEKNLTARIATMIHDNLEE